MIAHEADSTSGSTGSWAVRDLGRMGYREAWALQKETVVARHAGEVPDTLLICEHDAVVTTGRGTPAGAVLDNRFPVEAVERGGEATYHGPGQVVVYPIVKLVSGSRDLHRWLRALEEACIDTLSVFGLNCGRREGATGVWLGQATAAQATAAQATAVEPAAGPRKIVSIGVAANRWVSWHGLALNHQTRLEDFAVIRPCGFDAAVMTSMAAELGERCPTRAQLLARLLPALQQHLTPFGERGMEPAS